MRRRMNKKRSELTWMAEQGAIWRRHTMLGTGTQMKDMKGRRWASWMKTVTELKSDSSSDFQIRCVK